MDEAAVVRRRLNGRGRRGAGPSLDGDVERARSGSVAAFERLYRALSPAVAGYLRWHGVPDVDSVTNEVFAQVHRRLGSFSGSEQGFRSWVFTIAHHRMVDERRRAVRRPRIDGEAEISESAAVGDTEEDAFAALGDDRLRHLLDRLSPDQREVLLLRVVADLSLDDVAQTLGKRQGAIKALQHRAIASLRRHMAREDASP